MRKATGSYRNHSTLVKLQPWFLSLRWSLPLAITAPLVPEFAVIDLPWTKHSYGDDMLLVVITLTGR